MNFTRFKQNVRQWWSGHREGLLSILSDILQIISKTCGLYLYALVVGMGLTMGFFIIVLYL
ncbi:hypothetical protein CYG68_03570 [Morganella morganii]|uniref:Uncharacterized protein n=1 Tax=Morganella morganii TaxID=582 RepID=A0A8I0PSH6_MORMO|nr:hypothetical protein [Morganella morganii]